MADTQPTGPFVTAASNANIGGAAKWYVTIGGQQVELQGYPGTTLTFPSTATITAGTTTQVVSAGDTVQLRPAVTYNTLEDLGVPPAEPSSYVEQLKRLSKVFKDAAATLRTSHQDEVESEGDQDSLESAICYASLDNYIAGVVYGSTTKAAEGVEVGDRVILKDHKDDDEWEATVAFIEGESIGYQVDWP